MSPSGRWSRRRLLRDGVALGGLAVLALVSACAGAPPTPTTAPAAPAPTPTSAPAAPPQAAPTPTPAAPPAAKAPEIPDTKPGKFNVWYSANWNKVTDEVIGETFVEWGKTRGIAVEWQSVPGAPAFLAKISATVAAGQPPEICNAYRPYWYELGEMPAVDDLVARFKDQAGGMFQSAIDTNRAPDGKIIGVPYAIDVWPVHWREDVIKPVTGGRYFKSWDELIELGPKIQQPPRTYLIAFALGHEGDHVNNIVSVLWSYGGRLNDEEGVPDIKNPANKAGIEVIVRMWKAKLIPPDTFAATVTSWNNETYQKGRALMAINPATIMGWLLVNDKELAEKTLLANVPNGPTGAYVEATGIGFNYFKRAKLAQYAPEALEYFMHPSRLEKISKAVEGRFVPVYRDHTKNEFWEKSKFAEMKRLAEVGRVRNWPAATQPWLTEVTDAKYTLSDMMNKIINEGMRIEEAQEWAQREMMEVYNKFRKK